MGSIWPYMTPEYILYEMSFYQLDKYLGLVPKEKIDYMFEKNTTITKDFTAPHLITRKKKAK